MAVPEARSACTGAKRSVCFCALVAVVLASAVAARAEFVNPETPYANGRDLSLTREVLVGANEHVETNNQVPFAGTIQTAFPPGYPSEVVTTSVLAELVAIRRLLECSYRVLCLVVGVLLFWVTIAKVYL